MRLHLQTPVAAVREPAESSGAPDHATQIAVDQQNTDLYERSGNCPFSKLQSNVKQVTMEFIPTAQPVILLVNYKASQESYTFEDLYAVI